MATDSPVAILFNTDGYEVNVRPNVTIPSGTSAIIAGGSDSGTARFLSVDSSGRPIISGAGTAGTPIGGVVTVQGISGGVAIPISGTVTASNPSVGANGSPILGSSTQIGVSDGTNIQVPRCYDLDTGSGTQYNLGVNLRISANGGSVEFGTNTNPIRIDPTGTTTQPISGTITANAGTGNFNTNISQYGGTNVGAGNAIHVQPGTGATFNIAGTVSATQSGIWTVQPGNTANTTPWLTTISQGGNSAAVKPASTAAVSTDPALVVATSPNNTTFIRHKEFATFTALATNVTLASNKSLLSIGNASGSTVKCKILEVYIINVQLVAVTGVVVNFELRRATSHTAGTQITAIETMETTDSLNPNITVRTNATISGESSNLLWRTLFSSDEWAAGTLDLDGMDHINQALFPIYSRKDPSTKPITLNANEALTIKCATNTTVGTFDVFVVFTQE
jgi:hypothetical protein